MSILLFIQAQQRVFQEKISGVLHQIQSGDSFAPVLMLMGIGFIYGLLHAAGPGHGKIIIASYVMAAHVRIRRALSLTFFSAMMQALVAIALVLPVFYLLKLTMLSATSAAGLLETASFALVVFLGGRLVLRGVRRWRQNEELHQHHGHHHHHHHAGCCHHAHAPTPDMASNASSLREQLAIILAIGMRPCSGGIIMLYFSCVAGIAWAGVLAVLAMGLGVATATSLLALFALASKGWAMKFARTNHARRKFEAGISIAGGLAVIVLGGLLLLAFLPMGETGAITPANHPLMHHTKE